MSRQTPSGSEPCLTRRGASYLFTVVACCLLIPTSSTQSPLAAQEQPGKDIFSSRNGIPPAVAVYKGRRV
ncbi:MAG: hypothetical protein VB857_01555, partial [Pirellulaceae bacterium]